MTTTPQFLRVLPDGRKISAVSFGCSSIWAKPSFDEQKAMALLDAAVEGGINCFDTGPSYANGVAEARLGRWLRQHRPGPELLISTKVGTNFGTAGTRVRSFVPVDMERSLTDSLSRLGREQVDVLYLHGPSTDDLNDHVLRFFEREKLRGRILWSGVNSFDVPVLEKCVDLPIDAIMLQYNVSDQSVESLLPKLAGNGKIVVAGTALAQAIYSMRNFVPKNRTQLWYMLRALKSNPFFMLKGVRLKRRMAAIEGSSTSVALRFTVGHPLIHSAFFGTSSVQHMKENIESAHTPLSACQREKLFAIRPLVRRARSRDQDRY
jgi:aryl-alcohol dehydrogenase-like predicted oxidoreductase